MRDSKSTEEWKKLIAEQERSRQSAKEFCALRGVSVEAFYVRRSELRRKSAGKFVAVSTGAKVTLEIGGTAVTVAREDVRTLLEALK